MALVKWCSTISWPKMTQLLLIALHISSICGSGLVLERLKMHWLSTSLFRCLVLWLVLGSMRRRRSTRASCRRGRRSLCSSQCVAAGGRAQAAAAAAPRRRTPPSHTPSRAPVAPPPDPARATPDLVAPATAADEGAPGSRGGRTRPNPPERGGRPRCRLHRGPHELSAARSGGGAAGGRGSGRSGG